MWSEWERKGMHVGYSWESQKGKRPLGRPRRTWVDNIKIDLREIGWDGMDWIAHPTSAEVKKTWLNTSTPPYAFMA
jgi:hypothetical protein